MANLNELSEHSGGARRESQFSGWNVEVGGTGTGYCLRLGMETPDTKVCTGFYWIDDKYTPILRCSTCKYRERGL